MIRPVPLPSLFPYTTLFRSCPPPGGRDGRAGGLVVTATAHPHLSGPARLGKRTKDLTTRLAPGDIAVIDHEDIDRVAAEALVERRPAAVLNVAASTSGRYPNAGPQILVAAGIAPTDSIRVVLL